jgi:hypothetical protein
VTDQCGPRAVCDPVYGNPGAGTLSYDGVIPAYIALLGSTLGDGVHAYTWRFGEAVPEWGALGVALCLSAAVILLVIVLKIPVAVTLASVLETDEHVLTTEPRDLQTTQKSPDANVLVQDHEASRTVSKPTSAARTHRSHDDSDPARSTHLPQLTDLVSHATYAAEFGHDEDRDNRNVPAPASVAKNRLILTAMSQYSAYTAAVAHMRGTSWLRVLELCSAVLIIAHNVLIGSVVHVGTPHTRPPWNVFISTWEGVFPLYFAAEVLVRIAATSRTAGMRLPRRTVADAVIASLDIIGIVAQMLGATRWRVLRFAGALRMYRVLAHLPLTREALVAMRTCVVMWAGGMCVCVLWLLATAISARHVIGGYVVPVLAGEGGGLESPLPFGNAAEAIAAVLHAMCGDGVHYMLFGAMRMAKAKAAASGQMSASQVTRLICVCVYICAWWM